MEVGEYVWQRGGCQLGVQPVVVEQHVLPQFRIHAAFDQVIRQFRQFTNVVSHLTTAVHRQCAERQRLFTHLHHMYR